MIKEKLLTIREAAAFLGISEKAVIELSERGVIPGYKIGGVYLRFKQEQLKAIRISPETLEIIKESNVKENYVPAHRSIADRLADLVYFNDFYFFCLVLCLLLLYVVFYL